MLLPPPLPYLSPSSRCRRRCSFLLQRPQPRGEPLPHPSASSSSSSDITAAVIAV